jgi:hypothetical protein
MIRITRCRFSWRNEDLMPITIMTPVVRPTPLSNQARDSLDCSHGFSGLLQVATPMA